MSRWSRLVPLVAAALAVAAAAPPATQNGLALSLGQDRVLLDTRVLEARQLEQLQGRLFTPWGPRGDVVPVSYDDLVRVYPDLIADPSFDRERLDLALLLPQNRPLGRSGQFERAFDGRVARAALDLQRLEIVQRCSLRRGAAAQQTCRIAEGEPELSRTIAALGSAPGCEEAVRQFYGLRDPACRVGICATPIARTAYKALDDRCMASLTPWIDDDGVRQAPPIPGIFRPGPDGMSALDAIVLIERRGPEGDWQPYCGGLLLPGARVLTARHCFGKDDEQVALGEGRMRALRTSDGETFALQWTDGARAPRDEISDDVLVVPMRLGPGQAVPVPPPVSLQPVLKPAPAVALGYLQFRDFRRRSADAAEATPPVGWRSGLRFARPGLCHVIRQQAGCVRILCQTFPGYSGGPVFAEERDADGRLVLHGLVSQSRGAGALRCGAPPLIAPRDISAPVSITAPRESADRVSTEAVFPAGLNLGA